MNETGRGVSGRLKTIKAVKAVEEVRSNEIQNASEMNE